MKHLHCLVVALVTVTASWYVRAADAAPANQNAWRHKNWKGEIAMAAGNYRGLDKGVHVDTRCQVVVDPGVLIDGGRFDGERDIKWKVERSLFRKVEISGDLGLRFEANDSVFDDCYFHRRGPWFVAYWSTRWSFENCVFAKRFLPSRGTVGQYSVRAIGCTFYDIKLPKIEYKDDPSKQAQSKDLRFQHCRFVHCELTESALATTIDCIFDDCSFTTSDRPDWSKVGKPIVVNAFVVPARTKPPQSYSNGPLQINFQPATPTQQAGATLVVTRTGGAALKYAAVPEAGPVLVIGQAGSPAVAKTEPPKVAVVVPPTALPPLPKGTSLAARLAATAEARYNQSLAAATQQYLADLDTALQSAMRANNLDDAIAMRDAIRDIKDSKPVNSQFKSAFANTAKNRYEQAVTSAVQQYIRDLDAARKSAMDAGNLDEANAISATRKQLEHR